jgi:hypothetical protein
LIGLGVVLPTSAVRIDVSLCGLSEGGAYAPGCPTGVDGILAAGEVLAMLQRRGARFL